MGTAPGKGIRHLDVVACLRLRRASSQKSLRKPSDLYIIIYYLCQSAQYFTYHTLLTACVAYRSSFAWGAPGPQKDN
ncbi:hypothetical protein M378DRAFT_299767 [Amanita muscaria Koide BX008]|uniref:Uncharacterized protein n=1 Tax=Amanita muscaria (strain Koide BX008) TaxID=946122 RepID=A0A0C2SV27_AMAMK|nr:hypothetical protein M378DRAFT_299767 [Amanita muscaria Koide BX008]